MSLKIGFFRAVACLFLVCMCACAAHAQEKAVSSGSTLNDLMAAYNGESNANARYTAFSEKANLEGYDAAARLFRAAALAEEVHMKRHASIIRKLGGTPAAVIETPVVKSTKENLESAVAGETYESEVMYPAFLKQARKDGDKDAIDAFEDAKAAEAVHAQLFAKMLENLEFSKGLTKDFYVCPRCGNILDALKMTRCPICGTPIKEFKKVK